MGTKIIAPQYCQELGCNDGPCNPLCGQAARKLVAALQLENKGPLAQLKEAEITAGDFIQKEHALGTENKELHTRIEQLEANLPGENDIKHLSTCLVDCCPKCDDILLAYQRRLQARAKSQSSVGQANKEGK